MQFNPWLSPPSGDGCVEQARMWQIHARLAAIQLFERSSRAAAFRRVWLGLRNQPPTLRPLAVALPPTVRRIEGLVSVPLGRIIGSEDRAHDFDPQFGPLGAHLRERWVAVAALLLEGRPLPPVELLEFPEGYYIRDGHHRISVAYARGHETVEAVVLRCAASMAPAPPAYEQAVPA